MPYDRPGTAPAAYLSSRLSFGGGLGGGSRLAPITEFSVPHSGRGGFAHYPEQLGGGAYAAYDASRGGGGGGREREYPPSPPMDPGSATTHRFHSTHPRSPTQPQSLGSVHLDLTAVTAAAATMMHSDVLGGRCSPTTAHAFRSGRRPSHGHRLRILSKFTMYIDSEIEISAVPIDMQK